MFLKLPNINRKLFLVSFILLLTLTTQILTNQHTNAQEMEIQPLASVSCGTPGFNLPTNIDIGTNPFSVSKGDFNNDGITDLVTANFNANTISIFLGSSLGGFSAATNLPTNASPRRVAVADFNNDGVQDLAVANRNSTNLSFFLGSTSTPGTFTGPTNIPITAIGVSIDSGDFNLDGKPDLAIATDPNLVVVLIGNGTGSFFAPTTFTTLQPPNFINIADINKDGKPDIVTSSRSGSISVLPGNGIGSFGASINTITSTDAAIFSLGDINLDGNLDLITANLLNASSSILIGNGTGTFTIATAVTTRANPTGVAITDLDLDGKADLAITNSLSASTSFFKGNGDGTFGVARNFSVGTTPNFIITDDLNKDGKLDLIVSNQASRNISILTNTFSSACITPSFAGVNGFPIGTDSLGNTVGDFNLDGKQDVVVLNAASNNLSILLGTGTGGFAPGILVSTGGFNPDNAAVADFNKDGKPDLAVTNRFSDSLAILLGDGTGNFPTVSNFPVAGVNPSSLSIEDFNLDGNPDVVTGNVNGAGSISVFLGNGTTLNPTPTVTNVGLNPSLTTGDFNKDGKADIAVAVSSLNTLNILLGDGTGNFPSTNTIASGGMSPSVQEVGDFNSDGNLDLLITNFSSATGNVFLGNGLGSFTSGLSIASAQRLRFADFNSDGKLDIFAGTDIGTGLKIVLGNGLGGILNTVNLPFSFGNSFTLALSDFNNDARLDLGFVVSAISGANNFMLRLSNCIGAPNSISVLAGSGQSTSITTNFPTQLQAQVFDINNQAIPNASVAFNSPDSGPSGTFSNSTTAIVNTNTSGIATAPTFTANTIVGSYLVTASVNNGSVNVCTFFSLSNIAILENGTIYVADTLNNRIQKTSNDGVSWSMVGFGPGLNPGQFNRPRSVVADSTGSIIFVADTANNRIQRSTDSGNTWSILAGPGLLAGQVNAPEGLAYNSITNTLYIADTANNRIQVVANASSAAPVISIFANATAGATIGKVNKPTAVAVDIQGRVYVADTFNNRIQINVDSTPTGWQIFADATAGTSIGKVNMPRGIFVTSTNHVYIADTNNNRIQVNKTGAASGWMVFMPAGTAVGSVNAPQGVTVSLSGNAFIGDTANNRIQRKSITTNITSTVGFPGLSIGQFNQPTGVR